MLEEIGQIVTGKTPSSNVIGAFSTSGIPFVTPKDMDGRRWIETTERYLSEVGMESIKSYLVPKDGVAVSCIGSDMGKAILLKKDSVTNQQINTIIVDASKHNPKYIYYVLSLKQEELKSIAGGSATPILNKGHFSKVVIELPDKVDQDNIVQVLDSLDCKIELNNQINQTLESISQAIFKSWFIDFEPVRAKIAAKQEGKDPELAAMCAISGKSEVELQQMAEDDFAELQATAALFPDELVESELGQVPRGWAVSNFGEISLCFDSKRIPLSKKLREEKKGVFPYHGATSVMDYVDDFIFDGIYLLIGEDGSVVKQDGTPFLQYTWSKIWVNNHAHVIQGKDTISTEWLFLFMSQTNIKPYINGAVQLKLNQKNMNSIPVIIASNEINIIFNTKISGLFKKYRLLSEQNARLMNIRDSLLSKLLSGEVDVSGEVT